MENISYKMPVFVVSLEEMLPLEHAIPEPLVTIQDPHLYVIIRDIILQYNQAKKLDTALAREIDNIRIEKEPPSFPRINRT